ncbi:winged helix-turn-helix domain-containing protein [Rhizosaccharibacter radicis]|uniref:LysR family transcriptional regulator n=1 Tax=Rhizosaccharibacter radicis TaxID=2782605 RepID=A0ABT1W1J5_9PROT|nr:LysR family transcriptional regulator [Acetobacteraceae bacterium KSS12]
MSGENGMTVGPRLTLRVDLGGTHVLGHGKVRLLELIGEHGSISRAGRAMNMSYRRAWLLVDAINASLHAPAVSARPGGAGGGGATLTAEGRRLIRCYRTLEAQAAGLPALAELDALLRAPSADVPDQHPVTAK